MRDTAVAHSIQHPLGPIRLPLQPWTRLDIPTDCLRPHEESVTLARSIAVCVGGASVSSAHLEALAVAPVPDLTRLKRTHGRIIFAETFHAAITSEESDRYRGHPVHPATASEYSALDAHQAGVPGVYDREIHALIFPTTFEPVDHERVMLHELGHALTLRRSYRRAHLRTDLLLGLPPQIDLLLRAYPQGDDREAIRERVLEVLAEGYAWIVLGRWQELPGPVMQELQDLLTDDAI
jgi:hypothetical protein